VPERRFLPYEAGRFLVSLFEGRVFFVPPGPFFYAIAPLL
jgi:hypothetical protein